MKTVKEIATFIKNKLKLLESLIYRRAYISSKLEKNIKEQFHRLYYNACLYGETWGDTFWMGVPIKKCPFDLWVYQEIIFKEKPDLIIESGTAYGASALFLASICDLINNGEVVTIDIQHRTDRPQHKRIKYILGSSTAEEIVEQVKKLMINKNKIMVILDSDHSKEHVLNEMRIYGKFVTKGNYMIVEDSNVGGHPVAPEFGLGPMEAIDEFMKENKDFSIDRSKEKFYLSFNPRGYLKKIK
ncbi:MAG: cephalosporin hydroxylase [Elusimicrobia bacterium]|nr:cephalosporin hydroxylase [Elusimicrobiota bacterium]